MEESDRSGKSRTSSESNNVNINYHLVQKKGEEVCQTCQYLKEVISDKDKMIKELSVELEEEKADTHILSAKLAKMEALTDTLKQENQILEAELTRLEEELSREKEERESIAEQWCPTDRTYD